MKRLITLVSALSVLAFAACTISTPAPGLAAASPATQNASDPAAPFAGQGYTLITLGTKGGPVPSELRSQPASAIVRGRDVILLDAGDGTAGQLAKIGYRPEQVAAIFISHHHFDHTGGVAALMGLRFQTNAQNQMVVYGPPGTQSFIDGIIASMETGAGGGYAVPGAPPAIDPRDQVTVVEIHGDSNYRFNDIDVTAFENTHFSFAEGSVQAQLYKSFAYRFDMPDRSLVYTGDTGPSTAVTELAQGADILLSEMMDVDFTIALLRGVNERRPTPLPEPVMQGMAKHLRDHHLVPEDVGEMAAAAGVKEVVVTHFVGDESPEGMAEYEAILKSLFDGKVTIANDLDRF